ncbi:kinase-like domain-containing protein [Cyathus striatus]|nr:kinase-like domain-containing protein [Cyathus striatus]
MAINFSEDGDKPEWYTSSTWFLDRGYRLFTPVPSDFYVFGDESLNYGRRDPEPLYLKEFPYPFPHHSKQIDTKQFASRCYPSGVVGFAQDTQLRLVVLKYIKGDSEEYKCLRFIHALELDQTRDARILPVLDFLPCGENWFVIMPMWSKVMPARNFMKLQDTLDMIYNMLKALSFLHKHKIFHRDIKLGNFVFNFLPDGVLRDYWRDPAYTSLQSEGQILYSIIDFGESIKFPDNYSYEQCRLPYWESWAGTHFISDTSQGEFDFDPFAYDVGIMGAVFACLFQHLIPHAPMLAPLLDKMVTRNIQDRFTACQALQFLEEMRAELTEQQLAAPIDMTVHNENYEVYDRWMGLSAEFTARWTEYREPPMPRSTKILRAVCSYHPWLHHSIAWIRKRLHVTRLGLVTLYFLPWFMNRSISHRSSKPKAL